MFSNFCRSTTSSNIQQNKRISFRYRIEIGNRELLATALFLFLSSFFVFSSPFSCRCQPPLGKSQNAPFWVDALPLPCVLADRFSIVRPSRDRVEFRVTSPTLCPGVHCARVYKLWHVPSPWLLLLLLACDHDFDHHHDHQLCCTLNII